MTRLQKTLGQDKKLLSVYFTAGYPKLEDTTTIIKALEKSGVDFIEIGLPFSDPLADGPVIQKSSAAAISNGMTARLLFEQLRGIRESVKLPLILMGYFNSMLQFGVPGFLRQCAEVGIDGLIVPDLPPEVYESEYSGLFAQYALPMIFLVTPQTPEARIRKIDSLTTAFIYLVSSASITGNDTEFSETQQTYFKRIAKMKLGHPCIAGFGIHDKASFNAATQTTSGAIVGSAFLRKLEQDGLESVSSFVAKFR